MSDKKFGVAVFGTGRAGVIHLTNLTESLKFRTKVVYVVVRRMEMTVKVNENLHLEEQGVEFVLFKDVEKVFSDSRVDFVIVASTTHSHEEIIIRSLRAGKAVFCEKPLSLSLDGIKKCYHEARKAGLHLFCAFNRRFDPTMQDLRKKAEQGFVGNIHRIAIISRDCPRPDPRYLSGSGNLLHDMAIHDIDISGWILGERPVEVYAQAHAHDPIIASYGDWDSVCVIMKYPNHVITTVDLDRDGTYGYHQTVDSAKIPDMTSQIFGEEASLQSRELNPNYAVVRTEIGTRDLYLHNPATYSWYHRFKDSYVKSIEHFIDLLEGKCEVSVTEEQVVNDCIIADALVESIRTKRAVVVDYGQ